MNYFPLKEENKQIHCKWLDFLQNTHFRTHRHIYRRPKLKGPLECSEVDKL